MANLGELVVAMDLETSKFQKKLQRMKSDINKAGDGLGKKTKKSFGGLGDIFDGVGGKFGNLKGMFAGGLATGGVLIGVQALISGLQALGGAIKNVITEGIAYNSSMEQNTIAFEVMLGSMKEAESLMGDIKKFADVTPFATEGLVQSAKVMKQFGIETDKLMPNLKMLGDVALGDSERLKSLTLAFAQVQSAGKLMGQDLLQLINVGFNPLQTISEETGKSMAELKDMMSNGAISAKAVEMAFQRATSEGGRFFKGMEKLGKSYDGQMSTIKDTMATMKGMLTKPFFDFLSSNVLPKIQALLDGLMATIKPMMAFMGKAYNKYLKPAFDAWIDAFSDIWAESKETGKIVAKVFKDIWAIAEPIVDILHTIWITRIKAMAETVKTIVVAIQNLRQIVYEAFSLIKNIITSNWQGAFKNAESITKNFKDFFKGILQGMGRIVYGFATGFVTIFEKMGINVEAIFVKVFQWLVDKYDAFVGKLNELGKITIGGGSIFGKEIPSYTFGIPEIPKLNLDIQNEVDFAKGAIKGWLGLTNQIQSNTDALGDNSKMSDKGIDWASAFGKELGTAGGEADKLTDKLEQLTETIKNQAKSFANFVGIFDKVNRVKMSAKSVFHRMKGQVKEMERWKNAVMTLKERLGADSELWQEVVKQGPAKAGQTIALASMGDEQLAEYKDLFAQKLDMGMETAFAQQMGQVKASGGLVINVTGNNIKDTLDVDIVAERIANKLKIAGAY